MRDSGKREISRRDTEAGFAKIFAQDAVLGKETLLRPIKITEVRDAGLS